MLTSFIAYFALAGTTDWFPIVLFMIGIGLIVLELFIPDFGLAGLMGAIILSVGLYLTIGDVVQTVRDLTLAIFLTGAAVIVLFKNGYSFRNLNKLVLETRSSAKKSTSSKSFLEENLVVGSKGKAITPLRPSGKAYFGEDQDRIVDVLSESGLIATGSHVEIKKVSGSKIIVRSVDKYE